MNFLRGIIFGMVIGTQWIGAEETALVELNSFSKVSDFKSLDQLANGKVLGARVEVEGSDLALSVETVYLIPAPIDRVLVQMTDPKTLVKTEASDTLSLEVHEAMSNPAVISDFQKFVLDPQKKSHLKLLKASLKAAKDFSLNLSLEEAPAIEKATQVWQSAGSGPGAMLALQGVQEAWKAGLLNRAQRFQSGGFRNSPPYARADGPLDYSKEMQEIVQSQTRVADRFKGLLLALDQGGTIPNAPTPPFYYWENPIISGMSTITLGGGVSERSSQGYRILETQYYVSGNFYSSVILHETWPVTWKGAPATLVWRGDYVITSYITRVKGIEKMAAKMIFLIEVKKSVESFIRDCLPSVPSH